MSARSFTNIATIESTGLHWSSEAEQLADQKLPFMIIGYDVHSHGSLCQDLARRHQMDFRAVPPCEPRVAFFYPKN
jgi:hypothetical protein